MKALFSFSLLTFFAISNLFAGKLPEEIVKKVSALTVLIKTDTSFGILPTTGFVYKKDGGNLYILTKASAFEKNKNAKVVFYSGSPKEKTVNGNLLCFSERYGLAVVKVHAPFYNEPEFKFSKITPYRTMQLYIAGFDFKIKQNESPAGPPLLLTASGVAGLHKDKKGELNYLRLDTEIKWGNIGAPVIDAQGNLAGVLQLGLLGTKIAGVLTVKSLKSIFEGFVTEFKHAKLFKHNGIFKLELKTRKFDPFNSISHFGVALIPLNEIPRKAKKKKNNYHLPITKSQNYKKFTLKNHSTCELFELGRIKSQIRVFALQFKYIKRSGKVIYSPILYYHFHSSDAQPYKTLKPQKPDEKIEKIVLPEEITRRLTPANKIVNQSLIAQTYKTKDAEIVKLKLPWIENQSLFWGPEKKCFYTLSKKNILRKISYPSLIEQARFEFKKTVSSCSMAKCGIVAVCKDINELWLINKNTLAVEKRLKINKLLSAKCSPKLNFAFVLSDFSRYLSVIDLRTGKLNSKFNALTMMRPKYSGFFGNFTITDDGKEIFASISRNFSRFLITERYGVGKVIVLKKFIPDTLGNLKLTVSQDKRYFARLETKKIFRSDNPTKPIIQLPHIIHAIIFDKANGRILVSASSCRLFVYDAGSGKKLKEYFFKNAKNYASVKKMLFDPTKNTIISYGFYSTYKIKLLNLPRGTVNSSSADWLKPINNSKAGIPFPKAPLKKGIIKCANLQLVSYEAGKTPLLPKMFWSPDRKFFYIADKKGVVRKIAYPKMIQEAVINLGVKLVDMELAKSHLVVVDRAKTIRTLSLNNLKVTRKKYLPLFSYNNYSIYSSPGLNIGFFKKSRDLYVIDFNNLTLVNKITPEQLAKDYNKILKVFRGISPHDLQPQFNCIQITTDGKYLLCGRDHLYKFKIVGSTLKYLEVGPPLRCDLFLSNNCKHVILPFPSGIPPELQNVTEACNNATLIYDIDDFSNPISFINTAQNYYKKILYNYNWKKNYIISSSLQTYSPNGMGLHEYNIYLDYALTDSSGKSIVGLHDNKLYTINFSEEKIPKIKIVQNDKKVRLGNSKQVSADSKLQYTQIPFSRISVKDVKWLKNGHKCLILGEGPQGDIIYKLSYPDFNEINRVELNCRIKNMCLSKEHILAEIKDKQQVWIFDPSTLALKARISIGNASKLSACINSTVAFVADYDHLIAIDPENAEKIYQKSSIQLFAELASLINQYNIRGLDSISITPDGKSFLAQCNYIFFRCKLEKKGKLFPSDTIIEKYVKLFTLSNDSQYIALINSKKIIIRKIKDFSRIMTLNFPYARTLAFDIKARRLYVADAKGDLLILNARGKVINNYRIDRTDIKKILVHPQENGKMLIISGTSLYWATIKPNT